MGALTLGSHFSLLIRVTVGKRILWHLGADLSVFRCKKRFRGGHLPLKKNIFFNQNLSVGPNLGAGVLGCPLRRRSYVIERPVSSFSFM
jgi:hypothetical protein